MDLRCCHHPDREAAGSCSYCERPLCDECLSTNKEGKAYCRREDDCLSYQDDQSSPGESASPIVGYVLDTYSFEDQVRRLSEVLEELDTSRERLKGEADQRIPGYVAGKLAEEAAALAGLISFRAECMRGEAESSRDSRSREKAEEVKGFIEKEAEPKIRELLELAGPYRDLRVSELLESFRATACGGRGFA